MRLSVKSFLQNVLIGSCYHLDMICISVAIKKDTTFRRYTIEHYRAVRSSNNNLQVLTKCNAL
ncbi:MAG: hypothetical protein TE42_03440 [Candidatus Synechococcus spongiarum SP3]|uniref:Uncharacterized protein n=1 Tax=Candidatus Synechococcus spongiarum SP3 TaxID=1604020 RepID=A0A0G2HMX3_9SYNE|nr:MAG: hypothetical protein TE42_03440 [Candidatus Synechococcus spongiarum SP3]